MITLVPQLPCGNRYTEDWLATWERELDLLGLEHQVPCRPISASQVTKFFTDPILAVRYEAYQIATMMDTPGTLGGIMCLDVEFPGLMTSAIQTFRLMYPGLQVYGYLHAGVWCNADIWSYTKGRNYIDRAIFDTYDRVFVATIYHKEKIEKYFNEEFNNLVVVGFPFYRKDVYRYGSSIPFEEKSGVVICGRAEQSNGGLVKCIKEVVPHVTFLSAKTRQDYFEQINKAKVVISLKTEETFGISQLEAFALGSLPLCPNNYAYPEVISNPNFLYDSWSDLVVKLEYLLRLTSFPEVSNLQQPFETYEKVIETCVRGLS